MNHHTLAYGIWHKNHIFRFCIKISFLACSPYFIRKDTLMISSCLSIHVSLIPNNFEAVNRLGCTSEMEEALALLRSNPSPYYMVLKLCGNSSFKRQATFGEFFSVDYKRTKSSFIFQFNNNT